jgi:hypothetical protein
VAAVGEGENVFVYFETEFCGEVGEEVEGLDGWFGWCVHGFVALVVLRFDMD